MNKARCHRYFSLIKIRPNCPRQARYMLQPRLAISPVGVCITAATLDRMHLFENLKASADF